MYEPEALSVPIFHCGGMGLVISFFEMIPSSRLRWPAELYLLMGNVKPGSLRAKSIKNISKAFMLVSHHQKAQPFF